MTWTLYGVSPWWSRLGSVVFGPQITCLALPWTTYRVGRLSEYAIVMLWKEDVCSRRHIWCLRSFAADGVSCLSIILSSGTDWTDERTYEPGMGKLLYKRILVTITVSFTWGTRELQLLRFKALIGSVRVGSSHEEPSPDPNPTWTDWNMCHFLR